MDDMAYILSKKCDILVFFGGFDGLILQEANDAFS